MSPLVRRQLPNTLTVLRLFLAAGFFMALNAYRYPAVNVAWGNLAIAMFCLAALTDAFDGYLARRWHVESTFGRIMDPFCDKILILGAFVYLTGPRFVVEELRHGQTVFKVATAVYPWMVMLILARELLVTSIRGVVESLGVSAASNWSGKAKMILQSFAVPIVLALVINFQPLENDWAMIACQVIVYATVIVTVWSGLPYVTGLRRVLAQQKSGA